LNEFAKAFLGQIVAMLPSLDGMKRQLDRETGRRFSAFTLFNTTEDATSRVLGFLLDPKETHGQGDVFLRLFIARFVPEWTAFCYDQAKPASTTEKIDVTLSDGMHWLGIENKIFDAREQTRQVDRYLSALQRNAHSNNYRLIYLSPNGAMPSHVSFSDAGKREHRDKFVGGAWVHRAERLNDVSANGFDTDAEQNIFDWLKECHKECKAGNVQWFLQQFSTYVRSRITAEREPDMTDAGIINLALYNEDNLRGSLLIAENGTAIRKRIFSALLGDVETRLLQLVKQKGSDWELAFDWKMGRWSKQPEAKWLMIVLRRNHWPPMVGAAVAAERNGPDDIFMGIVALTETGYSADRQWIPYYGVQHHFIEEKARLTIAKAVGLETPQSTHWVLSEKFRDAEGRDMSTWTDFDTIIRLYKEKDAVCERIVTRLTELADAVDKALGPLTGSVENTASASA
jgi:hypothetical protein